MEIKPIQITNGEDVSIISKNNNDRSQKIESLTRVNIVDHNTVGQPSLSPVRDGPVRLPDISESQVAL